MTPNQSKTSRDFSSLLSSSNINDEDYSKSEKSNVNEESQKNRTHTLHTFSESYIQQLSKKLKEKTNQSFKDQENDSENENEKDKEEEDQKSKKSTKSLMNLNSSKNNRTQTLLKMYSCPKDVLREDSIKKENDGGGNFFNDSGNTTKKEGSQIELEEEEPQKLDVYKFNIYF